jgi:hexokinase
MIPRERGALNLQPDLSMTPKKLDAYLADIGLNTDQFNMDAACGLYLSEIERKLADPANTKELLPSYLSSDIDLVPGSRVAVLDAGGTKLRTALVSFNEKRSALVEKISSHAMPGSYGRISKEFFFDKIIEAMGDMPKFCNCISFCFSYPLAMAAKDEGRVIQLAKQLEVDDIVGFDLIRGLRDAFIRNGLPANKKTIVLNDSTAVLLSGLTRAEAYNNYVGFILGTGVNMAYLESCSNIRLPAPAGTDSMILNMEASRYDKMPRGRIDTAMDEEMLDTGDYLFEKMVSGKYLGRLCTLVIKDAAERGLFTNNSAQSMAALKTLETGSISAYFRDPPSGPLRDLFSRIAPEDDRRTLSILIDAVINRAALYCAAALGAVILKSGKGPGTITGIAAEGGTIRHLLPMHEKIKWYLETYLYEKHQKRTAFLFIENAALIGAAAAAFCR